MHTWGKVCSLQDFRAFNTSEGTVCLPTWARHLGGCIWADGHLPPAVGTLPGGSENKLVSGRDGERKGTEEGQRPGEGGTMVTGDSGVGFHGDKGFYTVSSSVRVSENSLSRDITRSPLPPATGGNKDPPHIKGKQTSLRPRAGRMAQEWEPLLPATGAGSVEAAEPPWSGDGTAHSTQHCGQGPGTWFHTAVTL